MFSLWRARGYKLVLSRSTKILYPYMCRAVCTAIKKSIGNNQRGVRNSNPVTFMCSGSSLSSFLSGRGVQEAEARWHDGIQR